MQFFFYLKTVKVTSVLSTAPRLSVISTVKLTGCPDPRVDLVGVPDSSPEESRVNPLGIRPLIRVKFIAPVPPDVRSWK